MLKLDFADISDLTFAAQSEEHTVFVCDILGRKLVLSFPNKRTATQFVSVVSGYKRTVCDPSLALSLEVCPRTVLQTEQLVHGPVSRDFILQKLESCDNKEACAYRQSPSVVGEYELVVKFVNDDATVTYQSCLINRDEDLLRLENLPDVTAKFANISELVHDLASGKYAGAFGTQLSRALSNIMRPDTNDISVERIKRVGRGEMREEREPKMPTIPEYDLKGVHKPPWSGTFTQNTLRKRTNGECVLVTSILADDLMHGQYATQDFENTLKSLYQVRHHQHMVKQLGVTGNGKVIEHSEIGNIVDYLIARNRGQSNGGGTITGLWMLKVFYQLAHVLSYLEKKGVPHGYVSGEKVLLFRIEPEPFIKLAMPEVRSKKVVSDRKAPDQFNTGALVKIIPTLKPPWIAVEHCSRTTELYVPSTAGDKWSFASTVCEIHSVAVNGRRITREFTIEMQERYLRGDVVPLPPWIDGLQSTHPTSCRKDSVGQMLRNFWSRDPKRRRSYSPLLRLLSTLLRQNAGRDVAYIFDQNRVPTHGASPPPQWIIPYRDEDLSCETKLGNGSYGAVYLCRHLITGEFVAVKQVRYQEGLKDFIQELSTMLSIKHKNIVEIKGMTTPSNRIVLEYLPLKSLCEVLPKTDGVPKGAWWLMKYAIDIAQGMKALHKSGIVHRDLALRNTLMAYEDGVHLVKISDFGLARLVTDDESYYREYNVKRAFPILWYAPECLLRSSRKYYFGSDIWSYGVTLWEIFEFGRSSPVLSGDRNKSQYDKLYDKMRLPRPCACRQEVYDNILLRCWEFNRLERISFDDIISELRRNQGKITRDANG